MRFLLIAAILSLVAPAPLCADAPLDSVVASNYPSDLHDFVVSHHLREKKQQAYASVSSQGIDYIVAAYSNGHIGAVVLLEKSSAGYVVDDEKSRPIAGCDPVIEMMDLDRDGIPEAIARFDTGKGGSQTWIYRINRKALQIISPTNRFGGTELLFPDIVDIAGDGTKDIVEDHIFGSRDNPTVRHDHYVLRNGVFVVAEPLDFYQVFYRSKDKPVAETASFSIPQAGVGSSFKLTVINGASSTSDFRVASGTVTMNGVIVSPPSDFSESRSAWTIPVTLQQDNTITVKVDGKPRGRIAIAIRHD